MNKPSAAIETGNVLAKQQGGVNRSGVNDLQRTVRQLKQESNSEGISGTETIEGLKKAASRFEAIFIRKMLDQGRSDALKSDLFKNSTGLKKFRSLLDARYAKKSASVDSGLGIGEMVFEQFRDTVEKTKSKSTEQQQSNSIDVTS